MTFFIILIAINILILKKYDSLAQKINLYDYPDKKLKTHKFKVPLLGGVILLINFFLIIFYILIFDTEILEFKISKRSCFSIIFMMMTFFLLGFFDDKYQIKPEKKFFLSIFISLMVLSLDKNLLINELKFTFYKDIIFLENFNYIFSTFCIIILINALNFYDGINGQSIIFFITNFVYLSIFSHISIIYILIVLILLLNLYLNLRNKLFMGDNGIYLFGSILIISIIYEYNYFQSINYADQIFFMLIIPGLDLLRVTIMRIFHGKNAFYGDRNHIHHLLINRYKLVITNFILSFLVIFPLFLFSFMKLNFFLVLFVITNIYIILILKLKTDDQNNHIWKKK
ncbi:Glycosyl transferase family 4 [Candidatus Pelagibacter sp. HIMB1321]|nr:Glycosyl transferase family 4 [Candidatus Pelagibacter sp. HIMB1321]